MAVERPKLLPSSRIHAVTNRGRYSILVAIACLIILGASSGALAQPTTTPPQPTQPAQTGTGATQSTNDQGGDRRQCGTEEAVQHFQRGLALYNERNPQAALFEFEFAYECAPNYRVLYNIGTTQLELNDYAAGWHTYNRYLREGGDEIDAERRSQVELELGRIRPLIGSITVTVDRAGAEVRLNDDVVGTSPMAEPLVVNIGRHEIAASAAGYVTQSQTVRVSAGDEAQVRLVLPLEEPRVAAGPLLAPTTMRREEPNRTGFWIALGSTGLLAAGAGVAMGLALSADSDLEDELDTYPSSTEDVDDARSRVRTWSTVTDVLGGAAIIAAVVTVLVYASEDGPDEEAAGEESNNDSRARFDGTSVSFTF